MTTAPQRPAAEVGAAPLEAVWNLGRPVDLAATLLPLRRGTGDPAHRLDPATGFLWAARTPEGPGTLRVQSVRGVVRAQAWGSGAAWLLDGVPALVGEGDDWTQLDVAAQPLLAAVLRRNPGLRLPRTRLVMDALVPAVLEQRVTGHEARRSWRTLLHWYGEPAPGPLPALRVPPSPETLLQIPTWDWHRLGVDQQRHRAVRAAATVAARLQECVGLDPSAALARLRVVPGVGEWTAAETAQRALGHPDAISVGDYHLKDMVVHFFTGRARGTDEQMCELLAPWTGQRQRVMRLIELSGVGKPRFGPRFSPNDIRRI